MAAAHAGWGDDGNQPVHYDPVAEAQAGWGDDESQPPTEEPATPTAEAPTEAPAEEAPAEEAPADTTEEEAAPASTTQDNEEGQVTMESKNGEMHLDEKWWMHRLLRRRFEHGRKQMVERNCEWEVKRWRNLEVERFRMHLGQQHGCIICERGRDGNIVDEGEQRIETSVSECTQLIPVTANHTSTHIVSCANAYLYGKCAVVSNPAV